MRIVNRLFSFHLGTDLARRARRVWFAAFPRPELTEDGCHIVCAFSFELIWFFEPQGYFACAPHRSKDWTGREPGRWRHYLRIEA